MGGVCSSASPLDRTPSELSFRAFQIVEDLNNTFAYPKPSKKCNVTPVDETVEAETENRMNSLDENKHRNLEKMAPKEVMKIKGGNAKHAATKSSSSSKASGGNIVGRVSNAGFGRAVEGIDLIVSGMTNLTPSAGFASASTTKGTAIEILAFEVANTIVKAANLMHSLSKENVKYLKEVVFMSDSARNLVSDDVRELERLAATDKRHELNVLAKEIVRFGNRCRDRQWHNLDRYFAKLDSEVMPQKQLKETARAETQYLLNLVKNTAELYHEMHSLDKFEKEFKQRHKEVSLADYERDTVHIIEQELKTQRKHVKRLKKKSLWSKMLEDVIEKLVDIVHFLHLEIRRAFDVPDEELENGSTNNRRSLGADGLALHYANIITQIDIMVSRSSSMAPRTRDILYQGLPPSIKSALRKRLQPLPAAQEVPLPLVRTSLESTLQWLVPIANNTSKSYHGFGRVGDWAQNRGEVLRRQNGPVQTEQIKLETLYYADKERTDAYILDLLIWLHHLMSQTRPQNGGVTSRSPSKSPVRSPPNGKQLALCLTAQNTENSSYKTNSNSNSNLNVENQEDNINARQLVLNSNVMYKGLSRSQDFIRNPKSRLRRNDRLSKSSGSWHPAVGMDFEDERNRVFVDVMDRGDFAGIDNPILD